MTSTTARTNAHRITDGQAMAGVKAGSAAAFTVLHDRYHRRAYRVARSVCHDDSRAQEAVQEAFLSIWTTGMNHEGARGVAPWLLTVVRNRAIDNVRRNHPHALRRAGEGWLESFPAPDSVTEDVIAHDDAHRLRTALSELPDEQGEVIALAFYEQLTHTEIAARMQLPLGTVKGRIRLALVRLRGDVTRTSR